MNDNSQFGAIRYPFIMNTILLISVAHYLNKK